MAYKHITYEVTDRVARITKNRPKLGNAQSTIMLEELDDAFKEAGFDPEVRVITLFGAGKISVPVMIWVHQKKWSIAI